MAINQRFLIVKNKDSKEIKYFDYDKIDGYDLKAKKDMTFSDAINVSRVIIINPSFSEKIATRKMNAKFERRINLMNYVCSEDDGNDETNLDIVLDETSKLRRELINKYKKFISEEKIQLMLKKLDIIERELKLRKVSLAYDKYEVNYSLSNDEELEGKKRR